MAFSETCARCGLEVRYGVRDGIKGYHHRDPATDHAPVFGNIAFNDTIDYEAIGRSRADKHGEADERVWDIPEPEVYATEIHPGDPRMPGGAKNLINACLRETKRTGLEVAYRATYSRGPVLHSEHLNLLRIADFVGVRLRAGAHTGSAMWVTDGKGKYGLDFAWITHYDRTTNTVTTDSVSAAELRAHLLPDEPKKSKPQT